MAWRSSAVAIRLLLGALQRRWEQVSKSADLTAAGYPDVATQFMASATLWQTATASQNGMSEQALPVSVSLRPYREREAETGQGVEPELIAVNGFYYRPFAVSVAR